MATTDEYAAVQTALFSELQKDIKQFVPGWAQGLIPPGEAEMLAKALAKVAVDELDAYRAAHIRP